VLLGGVRAGAGRAERRARSCVGGQQQRTQPGQQGQGESQPAQPQPGQQQQQQQQSGAASWLSSSKINGAEVKNQAQESVGTISELVVDPNSAQVIFAVVETRNFLGLNQKKYLIPWKTFRVDRNLEEADEIELILDTTREKLEKSFEFEADKMGMIRPEEVYSYWGQDFQQSQQGQQRQQGQQPSTSPSTPMRESGSDATSPGRPGAGTPGSTPGNPGEGTTGRSGTGTGSGSGGR
jgi:sporulation protein YlmC with PRC-barrel domain